MYQIEIDGVPCGRPHDTQQAALLARFRVPKEKLAGAEYVDVVREGPGFTRNDDGSVTMHRSLVARLPADKVLRRMARRRR